jgi:hypothetical protein
MRLSERPSDRCAGQWVDVFRALVSSRHMLDAIERGPRRHGYCPVHEGQNGDAFRVMPDFPQTGNVICNTCRGRSGFGALMWVNDWDADTTAKELVRYLDGDDPESPIVRAGPTPVPKQFTNQYKGPPLRYVKKLWDEAVPGDHRDAEPMRRYWVGRGLVGLPYWPRVRMHRGLKYYMQDPVTGERVCLGTYPTQLLMVTDAQGRFIGVHRTYLTPDGQKAPVPTVKKLYTAENEEASGGGVLLTENVGDTLCVAEGFETTAAVHLGTGGQYPVWVATSAPLLGSLVIPDSVRYLYIFSDCDIITIRQGRAMEAGKDNAERLRDRLAGRGIEVRIFYPQLGRRDVDWLDVWNERGKAGFPILDRHVLSVTGDSFANF